MSSRAVNGKNVEFADINAVLLSWPIFMRKAIPKTHRFWPNSRRLRMLLPSNANKLFLLIALSSLQVSASVSFSECQFKLGRSSVE